jgi:hypothetical protein
LEAELGALPIGTTFTLLLLLLIEVIAYTKGLAARSLATKAMYLDIPVFY